MGVDIGTEPGALGVGVVDDLHRARIGLDVDIATSDRDGRGTRLARADGHRSHEFDRGIRQRVRLAADRGDGDVRLVEEALDRAVREHVHMIEGVLDEGARENVHGRG